jgi:hypothetical protein
MNYYTSATNYATLRNNGHQVSKLGNLKFGGEFKTVFKWSNPDDVLIRSFDIKETTRLSSKLKSYPSYKLMHRMMDMIVREYDSVRTYEDIRQRINDNMDYECCARLLKRHQESLSDFRYHCFKQKQHQSIWCHVVNNRVHIAHLRENGITDYSGIDSDLSFGCYIVLFPCSRLIFLPVDQKTREQHFETGQLSRRYAKEADNGKGCRIYLRHGHLLSMRVDKAIEPQNGFPIVKLSDMKTVDDIIEHDPLGIL